MEVAFAVRLPRQEASVPVVRTLCRESLRNMKVSDECIFDITVALTEACTNVLKHAHYGEDEYEVDFKITAHLCQIVVRDGGRGFDGQDLSSSAMATAESGRGLHLMSVLVDDVDFSSAPGPGMTVRIAKELEIEAGSALERA